MSPGNKGAARAALLLIIIIALLYVVFVMQPFDQEVEIDIDAADIADYKEMLMDSIEATGGLEYDSVFTLDSARFTRSATIKNYISDDGSERTEGGLFWGGEFGEGNMDVLTITEPSGVYTSYTRSGETWVLDVTGVHGDLGLFSDLPFSKADILLIRTTLLDTGFSQKEIDEFTSLFSKTLYAVEEVPCGGDTCTKLMASQKDSTLTILCRGDGFCPSAELKVPSEVYLLEQSDPVFRPLDESLFESIV